MLHEILTGGTGSTEVICALNLKKLHITINILKSVDFLKIFSRNEYNLHNICDAKVQQSHLLTRNFYSKFNFLSAA